MVTTSIYYLLIVSSDEDLPELLPLDEACPLADAADFSFWVYYSVLDLFRWFFEAFAI